MEEPWEIQVDNTNPVEREIENAAPVREAVSSYIEAGRAYGGRSLHAPDGKYANAHFVYPSRRGTERVSSRTYHGRQRAVRQRYDTPVRHASEHHPDTGPSGMVG